MVIDGNTSQMDPANSTSASSECENPLWLDTLAKPPVSTKPTRPANP